jgi:hypothetical protein
MDDDGNPLDNSNQYGGLEVAYILPYVLTKQLDGELVWRSLTYKKYQLI